MWLQAFAIGRRVRHTERGILNSEGNFPITTCSTLKRTPTLCDLVRPHVCLESPETLLYSETSLSFGISFMLYYLS